MRLKGNIYFSVVIMIIMFIAIVDAVRMHYIQSKILPLIVAATAFILTAVTLVDELTKGKKSAAGEDGKHASGGDEVVAQDGVAGEWRDYLRAFAWIIGVSLGVLLVGFLIAVPVFMLAYSKVNGSRWIPSVVFTAVAMLCIWGMFEAMLGMELFRGLLFGGTID